MEDIWFVMDKRKGEKDDKGYEIISSFEPTKFTRGVRTFLFSTFLSVNENRTIWRVADLSNNIPIKESEFTSQDRAWLAYIELMIGCVHGGIM